MVFSVRILYSFLGIIVQTESSEKVFTRREAIKVGLLSLASISGGKRVVDIVGKLSSLADSDASSKKATSVNIDQGETLIKPKATIEQIDYIKNFALDPIDMIVRKSREGTSVVGLGEMHNEIDIEEFANRVVGRLASLGIINFLSLEIDYSVQGEMNDYMETGEMGGKLQKELAKHNTGYKKILESAKEHGLVIVCADNNALDMRDDFMSLVNLLMLEKFPGAKGLFYAGNGHASRRLDLLAQKLGDKYVAALILNGKSEDVGDTVYDAYLKSEVSVPVGIDKPYKTPFSLCTYAQPYERWSEYGKISDALIILPPQKPT